VRKGTNCLIRWKNQAIHMNQYPLHFHDCCRKALDNRHLWG
jgi:hypothetical protein